jgi:hypothetical protein
MDVAGRAHTDACPRGKGPLGARSGSERTGQQTLRGRGRQRRHPAGDGGRTGQLRRLATAGRDPGYPRGAGTTARADERESGPGLWFGGYPQEARVAGPDPRPLREGQVYVPGCGPRNVGWSARTPGAMPTRSFRGVPSAGAKTSTSGSPSLDHLLWITCSGIIIIVGRLIPEVWTHYRVGKVDPALGRKESPVGESFWSQEERSHRAQSAASEPS